MYGYICEFYILCICISNYVVFHCELPSRLRGRFCVGLVLDQRGRRWVDIFYPLGRRYYICRMFSVIYEAMNTNVGSMLV